MVNPLPVTTSAFLPGTDFSSAAPTSTLATSALAAPQAAPNVGIGTLFQSMLLTLPQQPRELVAQALEKGAPVLGGAGGAMAAGLCGACLLGIAGGAMVGKEVGGVLGGLGASAIRGPAQPPQ